VYAKENVKISDLLKKTDSSSDDKLDTLSILRELSTIVSLSANLTDNKRLARVVTGISVLTSVSTVGSYFYTALKNRSSASEFVVKVSETDRVFAIAEKWLNDALHEDLRKSVFVRTTSPDSVNYSGAGDEAAVPDTPRAKKSKITLTMQTDGAMTQDVVIAGFPVKISTTNPLDSDEKKKKSYYTARSIVITCGSVEARNAIVGQLQQEAQKLVDQPPTFNTSTSWGGYRNISEIPHRPIESVILKEGQMDRIIAFMRRFLDNEPEYIRLGVPYRTGIMLHGNPGSGKSSTASAIAHELGLNIYYISLSGLDGDDSLARALNEVPPYSLAILEDVDVYNAVQSRKDSDTGESNGVTLAGMLNVLDGFNSPHGVITIMTTNHIDSLDPAIIRPGRVDLMEELNELDDYQLRGICEYFVGSLPEGLPSVTPDNKITSAQIVGIIRNHIPKVQNSGDDILKFVQSKVLDFTK
jgi:AAA+ superfamily predicted ATPase